MSKRTKKTILLSICLILFSLVLTSCVPGDGSNTISHPAGFFSGIWHGWIAPFSLVGSFFNSTIGIYEVYNNGFSYNLGFYMAIISGFGGLALFRKKEKKD